VGPGFPRVAQAGVECRIEPTQHGTSGRRVALAQWLTHRDNPLVARVIANRVWQFHFGRGLSDTPSDFGMAGDEPTHPELLDWLARELLEHDWSLKHLHRVIVTSSVYRQASRVASEMHWQQCAAIDARNRWYWHY